MTSTSDKTITLLVLFQVIALLFKVQAFNHSSYVFVLPQDSDDFIVSIAASLSYKESFSNMILIESVENKLEAKMFYLKLKK